VGIGGKADLFSFGGTSCEGGKGGKKSNKNKNIEDNGERWPNKGRFAGGRGGKMSPYFKGETLNQEPPSL